MYASLPNLNQWRQSHRIMGVAIAYDLCCEGWDEAFRRNVYHYLLGHALNFSRRLDIADPLNFGPLYGYGGQTEVWPNSMDHVEGRRYMCAAAVGAMAIMGDTPPIYRPRDLSGAKTIEPEANFEPMAGVPVVELDGGKMFNRWLLNGPFHLGDTDPLSSIGGLAKARPIPGTTVVKEGIELDFRHYIPTGSTNRKRGPHIYPRNCGMYFNASTGQGYWPGRKLQKIYKSQNKNGTALTWYTVWENPDDQYIQCFPNLYWQSRNVRMWLAGVEVTDQEVIRVKPGFYPVMVHIPVTGGYSNQGPHLRWYSVEQYQEEQQRADACEAKFAAGEESLPRMLARAIGKDLRLYLLESIDRQGWNAVDFPEHLYPFLSAYRHVFGENLASDTGVEHIAQLAALGRDQYQSRSAAHALYHAYPFLNEAGQGVARWYYDRYPLPTRRPVDYILPFVQQDFDAKPVHPKDAYPLVNIYPDRNTVVFNRTHERTEREDFSVILEGIGRLGNPRGALTIELTGIRKDKRGGSNWMRGGGHSHEHQRDFGSIPYVQTYYNTAPARMVHHEALPDGSGSVTMDIGPLFKGRKVGKKQELRTDPKPLAGSGIRRAIHVDYSGEAGAPVVVLLADRYRGLPDNQGRFFQFFGGIRFSGMHFEPGSNRFRLGEAKKKTRGQKLACAMVGTVFADREVEFRKFTRNKEGTVGIVQDIVGRNKSAVEKEADPKNRVVEDEGDDDDLLDLLEEDAKAEDSVHLPDQPVVDAGAAGAQEGDEVMFVVMTVSTERPPEVERFGKGQDTVIQVGEVRYRFDGVTFGKER